VSCPRMYITRPGQMTLFLLCLPPRDKVYIAPSGVQKERILPSHIFVLPFPAPDGDRVFLRRPSLNLKESACTPLFWNAFDLRGAGSCIHTHSQNAVIVTLLTPGNMFRISHQVGRKNYVCENSYAYSARP
jgi:methylthioribulose-1-phosphate dehydratase